MNTTLIDKSQTEILFGVMNRLVKELQKARRGRPHAVSLAKTQLKAMKVTKEYNPSVDLQ